MEHGRSPGDRRSSQDGVQTGLLRGVLDSSTPVLTIAPPPCRPFRQWYEAHYGVTVGRKQKKKAEGEADAPAEPAKQSKSVKSKIAKRQEGRTLDSNLNIGLSAWFTADQRYRELFRAVLQLLQV